MVDEPPRRKFTEADFAEVSERTYRQSFLRGRAIEDATAALAKLHDHLVADAQLYLSDDLQDQRDAVAHALTVLREYLIKQGFSALTVAPLARPVMALAERENNSLDLMFTQRARDGRPRATLRDHERTGILAALAEAWLRLHPSPGQTQARKLSDAARAMKGRWFGKVTSSQLKRARETVSQETKDHPARLTAQTFYRGIVEAVERFGPEEGFRVMIHILNDRKLPFGTGEGGISKTLPVSENDIR